MNAKRANPDPDIPKRHPSAEESGTGQLIRRGEHEFARPVEYVLANTTGTYSPADQEEVGTVLLLKRQNGICIAINVRAIEPRVDAPAAAKFEILALR